MNKVSVEECRACLKKVEEKVCQELFQAWCTPWAIQGVQIADDLAKIADVEISENDKYSKVICPECYNRLADACSFMLTVQSSDIMLRKRINNTTVTETETTAWPKPILLNKNLNENINNKVQVEIKEEVLSDNECGTNYVDQGWEPQMDIKIEPEELVAPAQSSIPEIKVNGAFSLSGTSNEAIHLNGRINYSEEEYLDNTVKQEALSGDEADTLPDLSLDCILCMKAFNSVTGLKAHVIAQHSYGTVERKTEINASPAPAVKVEDSKLVCATCRQSFKTRTDLMVHEAQHNKHACFVCGAKFTSFRLLSRHGARCRPRHAPPVRARPLPRPKEIKPERPLTVEQKIKAILDQIKSESPTEDTQLTEKSDPTLNNSTLKIINTDDQLTNRIPVSTTCNAVQVLSINPAVSSQATTSATEGPSQHVVFNSSQISQNNSDTTEEDIYILPNILNKEEIQILSESSLNRDVDNSSSHDLNGNSKLSEETNQHDIDQEMKVHLAINPLMDEGIMNPVTKMEVEDVQVTSGSLEPKLVSVRSESDKIIP